MRNIHFKKYGILLVLILVSACQKENPLNKIMAGEDPKIKAIAGSIDAHNVQILYTTVSKDTQGRSQLKSWSYGLDENRYFYPASTAKFPIVLLTLEKLNALQKQGVPITKDTPFHIINSKDMGYIAQRDSTKSDGLLTIGHLIKKIFLVSDNDAYNYLFDFLGTDYINATLQEKGFNNTQIHHKFLFGADNQSTWEYVFFDDKDTLYHQATILAKNELKNQGLKGLLAGVGYLEKGSLVEKPMDFSQKNSISIRDLEGMVQRVILPEMFPTHARFDLANEDYEFVRFWMSRNTLESTDPKYRTQDGYFDSYVKFLIFGDVPGQMDGKVRIYNKVGEAYGTLTDTAYIVSEAEDIAFFLTATVFVNENQVFNDDQYEYETLGFPFLGALGRAVLALERSQKN